jgi:hypothetical protein
MIRSSRTARLRFAHVALLAVSCMLSTAACGGDDDDERGAPSCDALSSSIDYSGTWSSMGCGTPESCTFAQAGSELTVGCPSGSSCSGSVCAGGTVALVCTGADGGKYASTLSPSNGGTTLSGQFTGTSTCSAVFSKQ